MSKSAVDLTAESPVDIVAACYRQSPMECERVKKRKAVTALSSDEPMLKRFYDLKTFTAQISFVDSYINKSLIASDGIDCWWQRRIGYNSGTEQNSDVDAYHSPDSVLCREACLDLLRRKSIRDRMPRFFAMSDDERSMLYVRNFDIDMTDENPAFYERISPIIKLFCNQLLVPASVKTMADIVCLVTNVVVTFEDDVKETFDAMAAIQQLAYLADVLIEVGSEKVGSHRWPVLPLCHYVSKMESTIFSQEPALILDTKMKWDEIVWRYNRLVFGEEDTDSPLFEQIISIAASFNN